MFLEQPIALLCGSYPHLPPAPDTQVEDILIEDNLDNLCARPTLALALDYNIIVCIFEYTPSR